MPIPIRPYMFPTPLTIDVLDYNKLLASYNAAPSTIQGSYKVVLDNKVDNLLSSSVTYFSTLQGNINNLRINSSN